MSISRICGMCLLVTAANTAAAAKVEYLGDLLLDRAISVTQGWGYLGIDTMVVASVQVPKPILHLGELGIDSRLVPSSQPAAKLRIKDKQYSHGLGHHANGEIVFDLSGQFKTFEAEVGLQWSDGKSTGSVIFQVLVDGRKVFDSGVIRENDPPRPVRVSVEGADELRLVANDAGDGITSDCADWADARLTRDPAAAKSRDEPPVDVAPFARVLSWDPKVMQGTKANRSDEFPAEDIAPYREILPSAEKTYAVPVSNGMGCIGLQWDENRILRRVALEFPSAAAVPPAKSIQLQYWTGESEWQGNWQPAEAAPEKVANSLIWRFGLEETKAGTQKVRWVFADAKEPIAIGRISAFTRSQWKTADVRIEPAVPATMRRSRIEVYNGVFSNGRLGAGRRCRWDGATPLLLKVRYSTPKPYKADRTVLRFQMPDAAFGVAVEDLLTHDFIYVPHANLLVTRQPSPLAIEDNPSIKVGYAWGLFRKNSTLEMVRQRLDMDFHHACAVIHNRLQDIQSWAPTLISLACDNRKILVYRDGSIVFNEYNGPSDFPGESDGIHTVAANIGQWRFAPSFGSGQNLQITRHLAGGWLPMPVTTLTDKNVAYRQTTFVAPVDEAPAGGPAWLRQRALGVAEYVLKNNGQEPAEVRLAFQLAHQQDPGKSVQYRAVKEGILAMAGDRVLALIDVRDAAPSSAKIEPAGVVLSGTLPAGAERTCAVYLPAWKVAADDYASLLRDGGWASRVENYWKKLLEPAVQIEIPDEFLGNLIRASQVNCMLAARNQDRSRYVVPWISGIFFAYPESEANSIMRGMDMTGHPEFARRGSSFI